MLDMLILAVVMVVGAFLFNWIIKKPENMVKILLLNYITFVFVYLFTGSTDIELFSIGGIQVYINDSIMILMIIVLLVHVNKKSGIKKMGIEFLTVCIVLVIIISLIIGFVVNGVNGAFVGDIRTFFYFFIALIYFKVFIKRIFISKKRIEKDLRITMNFFLVFSFIMWFLDIALGIHNFAGQVNGTLSDGGTTMRIAHPEVVFLLAVYTCFLIYKDLSSNFKNRLIRPLSLIYILAVILHQQRTVWIAFAVGILCVFLIVFKEKKYFSKTLFIEIMGIVFVSMFLVFGGSNNIIFNSIINGVNSFQNVATETGTFGTRIEVWRSLLRSLNGVESFVGEPFGSGYAGDIGWEHSPHNGIVQWIMRTGYLGLTILSLLIMDILLLSKKNKVYFPILIIVMSVVYWIGYGFTLGQGVLIGGCIGFFVKFKEINDGKKDEVHEILY